ncbi:MAG: TIGR03032 family protein [Methyloceanibacter sp.]|uniref:TIGR03032 family protein n=1 Tax=Methyloceanibacter sp. TaxID=1965321 RepID=UPI003D6CD623
MVQPTEEPASALSEETPDTSAAPESEASLAEMAGAPAPEKVTYSMSPGLPGFLGANRIGLAISSYQSGKFYLLGQNVEGGLLVDERFFRKAMGICVPEPGTVLLATLFQIIKFRNVLEPDQQINGVFGACYVPRELYVTGELDAHDIGQLADGRIVFVNTLYNCLATPSARHSFTPIWKPPFISKIIKEDRCHLNGLAMENGVPRYVTAVSKSDTIDGWRDRRFDGGIVIDVETGEIVIGGLSMPHSPRVHAGKLFVLNSGTGELGFIERAKKAADAKFHVTAFCPGFVRGLSFHGKFALVGLSKPRYQRFEGLALDKKLADADSEPWCGVQVIDLESGACVHWFRIDGPVGELYDVAVVPDVVRPMSLSFASNEVLGLITHDALQE